ncbi:GNAT family N-acetyltransferase [Tenggerimyces flavus]|uniref:GNAT family N-acetyltransferase n=1 Tax=Tenggerimyces flavus TaxID=1708749 RepID=A0ABV7YMA4_9ACTN|nr:GNAT family N-acetyltransferase [Tenggerimyces flavus]MBM7789466.1 GNAT superfamily N-acetyltransferase [Tenggerimyces flavus]
MGETTVRLAGPGDLDVLAELNAALFAEDSGTRDPFLDQTWPVREARGYFAAALDDGANVVVYVADAGDAGTVGYLIGRLHAPNSMRPVLTGELESMYVRPPNRSSGTGSLLVRAFLRWADECRVGRVAVTAYAANEGAIRFYGRFGLRPKSVTLDAARS